MKLKIKETAEKKIDVEYPYYTKSNAHMFKFIDEHTIIVVHFGFEYKSFSIEKLDMDIPKAWICDKKSTKEEFDAEYNKVLELIQKKL